jgi:hypothetical protein
VSCALLTVLTAIFGHKQGIYTHLRRMECLPPRSRPA